MLFHSVCVSVCVYCTSGGLGLEQVHGEPANNAWLHYLQAGEELDANQEH